MSDAFRCDECGAFHEGRPALQITVSLDVNGKARGLLGSMFSSSDGGDTVDLCGLECYQNVDLNAIRDDLLADLDNKEELLDADLTPTVEVDRGE